MLTGSTNFTLTDTGHNRTTGRGAGNNFNHVVALEDRPIARLHLPEFERMRAGTSGELRERRERGQSSFGSRACGSSRCSPPGPRPRVLESQLVSLANRLTTRPERRRDRFSMLALYDYARSGAYQLRLVAIRRRAIVALAPAVRLVPGGRLSVSVSNGDGVSQFHGAPFRARLWLREGDGPSG